MMSALKSSTLPDRVAMHWNAAGQVDRYGSKWEAMLFIPFMMLVFALVFGIVMAVGAERLRENTTKALNIIAAFMTVFFLVIHKLVLGGNHDSIPQMIPFLFAALLIVLGYAMRGVEPNPFVGIRVPWTMNNPNVWRITHDRASKLWMASGVVCLVLTIVGFGMMVPILVFTFALFFPILDSYRISKLV